VLASFIQDILDIINSYESPHPKEFLKLKDACLSKDLPADCSQYEFYKEKFIKVAGLGRFACLFNKENLSLHKKIKQEIIDERSTIICNIFISPYGVFQAPL
jgi:hypothetical protein